MSKDGVHTHWRVIAYGSKDRMPPHTMTEAVTVDVIADTRTEALELAAELVPYTTFLSPERAGYEVVSIYQRRDGTCTA